MRQDYKPRENVPKIITQGNTALVGDELWNEHRIGCAILIAVKYCCCGNCDACRVGLKFLSNPDTPPKL